MKKQVPINVQCPHCLTSLMDTEIILNGHPSIKLNIITPEGRGEIYICSVYECFDHRSNIDIKDNTIVDFYCPECDQELLINEECKICDGPMVTFLIQVGGRVSICSRKGCSNHYVAFTDLSEELGRFYDEYSD
jgi:hypothetical protein